MIPSYLIEGMKCTEQWKRTLYVLMKTWSTITVYEDFWIFLKNNVQVIFEWSTKKFYFIKGER